MNIGCKKLFSMLGVAMFLLSVVFIPAGESAEPRDVEENSAFRSDAAVIHGWVNDSETGVGIEGASVFLSNWDIYYYNSTVTNETGYYEMGYPGPGTTFSVYVYAEGYKDFYGEVTWEVEYNISLEPKLPQNSIVCGYIKDSETNEGIYDAYISISGTDVEEQWYWNSTYTNETGYFEMNVPAGNFYVYTSKSPYQSNSTDYFDVSENTVVWKNLTLKPPLPENSVVCGYIKDSETNEGIYDAYVSIWGTDVDEQWYSNYTYTTDTGYYEMNVPTGNFYVYASKYPYTSNSTDYFDVSADTVVWKNLTLKPPLPQNSVVCGFVTDAETGEGIKDAYVSVSGTDANGEYYYNSTYTITISILDISGFYEMNVPAGKYELYTSKDGYHSEYTDYFDVSENTVVWKNITLQPPLPENSVVCGYITDSEGNGLNMTYVYISGEDIYEYSYWNSTYTNETGYYEVNVPTGIFYVRAYLYTDYWYSHSTESDYFFVGVNTTFWQNLTLELYPENSVIHGYATDSETGEGISNAEVSVETPSYYWGYWDGYNYYSNYTYTNATGYYEINVPVGSFRMSVYSSGYYTFTVGVYVKEQNAVITKNIALEPGLEENSTVKGWVKDLDDNPLSYIYVRVSGKDISGHYYYNSTYTDADGYYEMNLPIGDYQINVEYYWWYWNETYYNDYHFETLGLYVLQPNSVIWQNLTPVEPLPETSIICGYINDSETGKGIPNANVYISRTDGGYYPWGFGYYEQGYDYWYSNSTYTNETGYYEINVPEGNFYVSAYSYEYTSNYTHVYVQPNSVVWVNLTLQPPLPENSVVKGYVTDAETNEPIEWAWVSIHTYYEPGEYYGYDYYWNYTSTDETGYYEMNLPEGEFEVDVSKSGYESNSTKISVDADSVKWLNITLHPPAPENSIIKGYVLDEETGEGIEDAYVSISTYYEPGEYNGYNYYYNSTSTNETGYYQMNVPEGNFSVYATAEHYFSNSTKVNISANTLVWKNLTLKPENSIIKGYITNSETGEPVIYAWVNVESYGGYDGYYNEGYYSNTYWNSTHTNATGYYQINVPDGEFEISVTANNYDSNSTKVSISANDILWLNITLKRPEEKSEIYGYITDSDTGEPLIGIKVELYSVGDHSYWYHKIAYTNETGYYQFTKLAEGRYEITAGEEYYFYSDFDYGYEIISNYYENKTRIKLGTNVIVRQDLCLEPVLPETSVVKGYVTDSGSGGIIKGAGIYLSGKDASGHYYSESAYTNETGYYQLRIRLGEYRISIVKMGYFENRAKVNMSADGIIQQDIALIHIFPKTSVISGYVYNATGEPIKHASVMIYNTTYYYHDGIETDENGYYEIYTWGGEFYLMASASYYYWDYEEEMKIYKTNITKVNIPENDKISVNIYLEPAIPDETDTTITFSDWGNIIVDSKYTMNTQSTFIRLMIDSWGNSDGYVSDSEVNEWMDMMMMEDEGEFPITVDDVYYETAETSYYFENLVGEITLSDIIIAHFTGNCTADIAPASSHTVKLEINYDTPYSTRIYHISFPFGYEMTDYDAPENVNVSGTTNVTVDPGKQYGWYYSDVVTITVKDIIAPTIYHTPVITALENNSISINTTITDNGKIMDAVLFCRVFGEANYTEISMINPEGNLWTAVIPASMVTPVGLEYYIWATDGTNNKNTTLYSIGPDTTPPSIVHIPTTTAMENTGITINATITENITVGGVYGVVNASLFCRVFGEVNYTEILMSNTENNLWTAVIPASMVTGVGLEYYIWATDGTNNISTPVYSITVPTSTSTIVDGKDVTVIYNGTGTLTVRSATVSEIEIPKKNVPSGMAHIGIFVCIDTTGTLHDAFITIKYNDSDVSDVDESKLRMYYWNDTISEWVIIEDSGVWTNNNTVWARISHFTIFAPMAEKTAAGPAPGIGWLIYVGVFSAVIIIIVVSLAATVKRKKKILLPPNP